MHFCSPALGREMRRAVHGRNIAISVETCSCRNKSTGNNRPDVTAHVGTGLHGLERASADGRRSLIFCRIWISVAGRPSLANEPDHEPLLTRLDHPPDQ